MTGPRRGREVQASVAAGRWRREATGPTLPGQDSGLDERADALLEEEWVAFGLLDQQVPQRHEAGVAAQQGDAFAIEVVRESGRLVGEVLAALVNFYNPDMIVIGGGVSNLGDLLLSSIRQAVFKRSLPLATRNLQIVFSGIGPDAGMLGAIGLGLDYVLAIVPEGPGETRDQEGGRP